MLLSDEKSPREGGRSRRDQWHSWHCDEFAYGNRLQRGAALWLNGSTSRLVFDVGFHDGSDTVQMLELGHTVVAFDANPAIIRIGLQRPTAAIANQTGQLRTLAVGIASTQNGETGQPLTFYVHKRISEFSTFHPNSQKMDEFTPLRVPTTTCSALIEKYGIPYYMKVDIEGGDAACIHSLRRGKLPAYISTEDPTLLTTLVRLGYKSFKMVNQAHARRGNVQSSGGMPEGTPGAWVNAAAVRAHPYWSEKHMHVRVDPSGARLRVEHDLHARLSSWGASRQGQESGTEGTAGIWNLLSTVDLDASRYG
jgi:FkbM family methyltransferase